MKITKLIQNMKLANAIGEIARIDLLDARLPQNLQSVKKKTQQQQYLHRAIKQNVIK